MQYTVSSTGVSSWGGIYFISLCMALFCLYKHNFCTSLLTLLLISGSVCDFQTFLLSVSLPLLGRVILANSVDMWKTVYVVMCNSYFIPFGQNPFSS